MLVALYRFAPYLVWVAVSRVLPGLLSEGCVSFGASCLGSRAKDACPGCCARAVQALLQFAPFMAWGPIRRASSEGLHLEGPKLGARGVWPPLGNLLGGPAFTGDEAKCAYGNQGHCKRDEAPYVASMKKGPMSMAHQLTGRRCPQARALGSSQAGPLTPARQVRLLQPGWSSQAGPTRQIQPGGGPITCVHPTGMRMRTQTHTNTYMHTHTHLLACTQNAYTHKYVRTHTHLLACNQQACARIHTQTRAHTRTRAHTHTQVRMLPGGDAVVVAEPEQCALPDALWARAAQSLLRSTACAALHRLFCTAHRLCCAALDVHLIALHTALLSPRACPHD